VALTEQPKAQPHCRSVGLAFITPIHLPADRDLAGVLVSNMLIVLKEGFSPSPEPGPSSKPSHNDMGP
jgi:hypothetical protein